MLSNKDKLKLIRKKYSKYDNYLEFYLEDYNNYNIYIRIDRNKRDNLYYLFWYDLNTIVSKNISKWEGTCYIKSEVINQLSAYINSIDLDNINDKKENYNIYLKVNVNMANNKKIDVVFNKYIPKEYIGLHDIIVNIFDNLPRKLEPFLMAIYADINDEREKYEYRKPFVFDLFHDELSKIFDDDVIEKGNDYKDRIIKLELIEDKYFAVVQGNDLYLVVVSYDSDNNVTELYCSCPCEFRCKHLYAVIKAIRRQEEKKFSKIIIQPNEKDLLDKVVNSRFYLSIGVFNKNVIVVGQNGMLEAIDVNKIGGQVTVVEDYDNIEKSL